CQQPLTANAIELIKKYRDFANNEVKAALDKRQRDLREYVAPITALKADTLQQQYASEANGGGDVLMSTASVLEHIQTLAINVLGGAVVTWQDKEPALAAAEKIIAEES